MLIKKIKIDSFDTAKKKKDYRISADCHYSLAREDTRKQALWGRMQRSHLGYVPYTVSLCC